jgi:hypothetical protein
VVISRPRTVVPHLRKQWLLRLRNTMLRPHEHTFCWMGEWFHFSPHDHLPLSGYSALCITPTSSAQSKSFSTADCYSVPLPSTAHCSAVSPKTKVTLARYQHQFHYQDFRSSECQIKLILNKIFRPATVSGGWMASKTMFQGLPMSLSSGTWLSSMMMTTTIVLERMVHLPFNHLMWLLARKNFT